MIFGSNDSFVTSTAGDMKNRERFCLFAIILALGFVTLFACTEIVDMDSTDALKFSVDGIRYETTPDMTVKVTGCGSKLEKVDIPSTVINLDKNYSVTSISKSAFKGHTFMTSAIIPDSVTTIGKSAFSGCKNLVTLTIGSGVKSINSFTFENCTSLTTLTIKDGVKSIGYSAFEGCKSLTSLTIPNSVTTISSFAFSQCKSLQTLVIGKGITSIGKCAFYICKSLNSLVIPDSVKTIGEYAFYGCTFYDSYGMTEIEDYSELPGHIYISKSPSKLFRLDSPISI